MGRCSVHYSRFLIRLLPVLHVHGVCLEADDQLIRARKPVLSFQKLCGTHIATSSGENLKLTKSIMSTQKPPIKGLVLMSPCSFQNCSGAQVPKFCPLCELWGSVHQGTYVCVDSYGTLQSEIEAIDQF